MKRRRLLFSLFLCLAILPPSKGQEDPGKIFRHKITPPSPDVASLGKYGEFPVSLNNGLVSISIPIYEINTGKLTLPISLSYHAGGVKVNDIASSVGLGWSLSAGGVVSRAIMGAPDESNGGILLHPFPDPDDPGEHFECFLSHLAAGGLDGKSDIFNYSLGGSNGKFLFKNVKVAGAPGDVTTIPYSPVRINVSNDFSAITIADLDGTIYTFGEPERTQVFTDGSQSSDANTAWYLTSILSADKSDTITFSYTEWAQVVSAQVSNSFSVRDEFTYLGGRITNSTSQSTNYHYAVNIEEIVFKNGKLHFDYETDRLDVSGGRRLDKIRLYGREANGTYSETRRFSLEQSYFTAEGGQRSHVPLVTSINHDKRLRLDSIYVEGIKDSQPVDAIPPHSFEYEGGSFPVYSSTAQDFMGYYNGKHENENLLFYGMGVLDGSPVISQEFGANREIDPDYIKAGILKKITFPTGGYTQFETEPNHHKYTATIIQPVYISYQAQVTSYNTTDYDTTFTVTSQMTGNQASILAQFKITGINNYDGEPQVNTVVRLWDQTANDYAEFSSPYSGSAYFPINSATDPFPQPRTVTLYQGHTYRLYYDDPQYIPQSMNFFYGRVSWNKQTGTDTTQAEKTVYTGGLRIKSITSDDGSGNKLKKRYEYKNGYYNTSLFSGDIGQMADKYKTRTRRNYENPPWFKLDFDVYGENFTFSVGSSTNTVLSYARVDEIIVNDLGEPLGRTVNVFNTAVDNIPSLAPSFRSDEEWKRGQLASQEIYKSNPNGDSILIRKLVNVYADTILDMVTSYASIMSQEGTPPGIVSQRFEECNDTDITTEFQYASFEQMIYKSNLSSSLTVQYDDYGANPDSTFTQYIYNDSTHHQLVRTIQSTSTNKRLTSNVRYPLDYDVAANCDIQTCIDNYNDALDSAIQQQATCEQEYYSDYVDYHSQASTIYFDLESDKDDYIEEHCQIFGGWDIVCIGNASEDFEDDLEDSQYHELLGLAEAAFDNYSDCKLTAQTALSSAGSQLAGCKDNYGDCIDQLLSGQMATKDKALLILQRDNVIRQVVENTSGFILGISEYITHGSVTDFRPVSNGVTSADVIWTFNSNIPIERQAFNQNPAAYYRKLGSMREYDDANNIVEKSKDQDVIASFIWDYDNALPVAEVLNAGVDQIAHTSFEDDGTGNFTIGSQTRLTAARTGIQCYGLGNGNISKTNLLQGKKYIVSCWAQPGTVIVNGSTLSPYSTESIDGWQYYEAEITGTPSVTSVVISGTAWIDELRFFPEGAQMTTYTYDPLVGITSQTDSNNQITYYEYDAMGRLGSIKDSKQNTLKSFKYNYREANE